MKSVVVLVDDDPRMLGSLRRAIQGYFRQLGIHDIGLEWAGSLAEAVLQLAQVEVDHGLAVGLLIITDYELGDGTGDQVADRAQELGFSDLTVRILTGLDFAGTCSTRGVPLTVFRKGQADLSDLLA